MQSFRARIIRPCRHKIGLEVPVMLLVVRVVNATRGWYEAREGALAGAPR